MCASKRQDATKGFLCSSLQEQLRMKDEALSAAQRATAEREELAQQLRVAEEEVARLRAGPKKVEQLATDNVKVGMALRTCQRANVNITPPCLQVQWKDQVTTFNLPFSLQSVSCRLQDGGTALTVAIQVEEQGVAQKS
jgi:hypothetical protein